MRRKPLVKYSSRKAMRSKGKFTVAKISRPGVPLKAEIALHGAVLRGSGVGRLSCRRQDNALAEVSIFVIPSEVEESLTYLKMA